MTPFQTPFIYKLTPSILKRWCFSRNSFFLNMDIHRTDNMVLDMGLALDMEPVQGMGTHHSLLLQNLMPQESAHLTVLLQTEHHSLPHADVHHDGDVLRGADALHGGDAPRGGDALHGCVLRDGDDSLDEHSQN